MTDKHLTDTRFDALGLRPELMQGIEETGFSQCTPIQEKTLPIALAGGDVAGQAQTGTGKTAAFLLALFQNLLTNPPAESRKPTQPRALVLAPTRELAIQIWRDAESLGKHTGFKLGLVYGGTGYESQREMLQAGIDVLIGTPGRIIDYEKQGIFNLKAAQVLVLDEADRMFDLGFIKDIRYLLRRMPDPDKRQNMLFSATLSQRVLELAYEHMNEPQKVEIAPERVTADRVRELVYHTANEDKIPLLIHLLKGTDPRRSLVFVNTKRVADQLADWLNANGLKAETISGDVPQKKREKLLGQFQTGELPVLVATDVAARGLHIPHVSHVFNFDMPQDREDYVHRIGRTARAGQAGDAISFGCEEYVFSLPDIEDYIGHKIPVGTIPADLPREGFVRPARRPRKPDPRKRMGGGGSGGGGGGGGRRRRSG
jgi:ATP-dependent RNA helicase RhlB